LLSEPLPGLSRGCVCLGAAVAVSPAPCLWVIALGSPRTQHASHRRPGAVEFGFDASAPADPDETLPRGACAAGVGPDAALAGLSAGICLKSGSKRGCGWCAAAGNTAGACLTSFQAQLAGCASYTPQAMLNAPLLCAEAGEASAPPFHPASFVLAVTGAAALVGGSLPAMLVLCTECVSRRLARLRPWGTVARSCDKEVDIQMWRPYHACHATPSLFVVGSLLYDTCVQGPMLSPDRDGAELGHIRMQDSAACPA
jgi:hypothetical protein